MIRKFVYAFLPLCLIPSRVFAGVEGKKDPRQVIGWVGTKPTRNIWNTPKYNSYVCIGTGKRCSSGEFISPKHILTNSHVATGCGVDGVPECTIQTSDKKTLSAKVVFHGGSTPKDYKISNGTDWSILEITTPNFCGKHYFEYLKSTPVSGEMWRAGFGQLRVMSDEEFDAVRSAYMSALKKTENLFFAWAKAPKGLEIDYNNLGTKLMTQFQEEFTALTDKNFVRDFLYDYGTLKLVKNCAILKKTSGMARHSCASWPGDSGSTIQNESSQITLLNNSGYRFIGGTMYLSFGVPIENIFSSFKITNALKNAKENCGKEPNPEPKLEPGPKPKPKPELSPDERDIGKDCFVADLPPHATVGHYIKSGSKKLDCANGKSCSCAATQCETGYYLVVNSSGYSQGWCYRRSCPKNQHLNIIDGYKTDTKCIDN